MPAERVRASLLDQPVYNRAAIARTNGFVQMSQDLRECGFEPGGADS